MCNVSASSRAIEGLLLDTKSEHYRNPKHRKNCLAFPHFLRKKRTRGGLPPITPGLSKGGIGKKKFLSRGYSFIVLCSGPGVVCFS